MQGMMLNPGVKFFFYKTGYFRKIAEFHLFDLVALAADKMMVTYIRLAAKTIIKPAAAVFYFYQDAGSLQFFQNTVYRRQTYLQRRLPQHLFDLIRAKIPLFPQEQLKHRFSARSYLEMMFL
jgi:hypothetical protein